jgi:hypothetical protein
VKPSPWQKPLNFPSNGLVQLSLNRKPGMKQADDFCRQFFRFRAVRRVAAINAGLIETRWRFFKAEGSKTPPAAAVRDIITILLDYPRCAERKMPKRKLQVLGIAHDSRAWSKLAAPIPSNAR